MPVRPSVCLLFLLAGILLLQGCVVSPTNIRRAANIVATTPVPSDTCQRTDLCAAGSPLLDAANAAFAASSPPQPMHLVSLLNDSEASMVARLNLIRAARRSIDIQTYIWDQDDAGQLVLDELVKAAQRGVKVRILADQLSSFDDLPLLNRLARVSPNFEVRLYNPTFHDAHTSPMQWVAGITCCFVRFNQRMHNKVFIVDDVVGLTGGRNYQNRYFDWDDDFDYVDRDVLVGGPAVKAMADSFTLFWQHKRSVPLIQLRDVNHYILSHPAAPSWLVPHYTHPQRVARASREADDPDWIRERILADSLQIGPVEFFSDLPSKTEQPQRHHALEFTHRVMQMIADAQQEVVMQTPYLVMSGRAQRIFDHLHKGVHAPRIVVSTNSLASTDAFAVYALSYKHREPYLRDYGFEIYEMKPHALGAAEANADASMDLEDDEVTLDGGGMNPRKPSHRFIDIETHGLLGSHGRSRRPAPLLSGGRRFGLHAKSFVIDDSIAMVGSHNFDPRSDHYNTEAGVIIYDQRFANQLRQSIMRDTQPENAWVIAPRRHDLPVLSKISQAIGDVSEHLPVFDLWPFRYATSYQLKAGCQPLRVDEPGFFGCYEPVGDFPDVAVSPKLIYTFLITAFGVGATGIL